MIKLTDKVRLNMPIQIGIYTFKDQDAAVIDLSSYTSVSCQLKCQGQVYATQTASFVSKPAGTVKLTSYSHTVAGIWMAQFYCTDGSGNKLWGEPIRYEVVENIEDASLNEVLRD